MRIASARLIPYRLPFVCPWQSRQGRETIRTGWLIRLETDGGLGGLGDVAPLAAAGTEPSEQSLAWLGPHMRHIQGQEIRTALEALSDDAPPAARCGLETALLDLLTRQREISISRALNPEAVTHIEVNAALGPLARITQGTLDAATEEGYSVIKLKAGIRPWQEELAMLRKIAMRLNDGVRLRLDANRAWSPSEAAAFFGGLEELPIEAVEEPLAMNDPGLLEQMQRDHPFAIAIDESLPEHGPDRLFDHPPCRRLVLKPAREGGLRRTVELAHNARAAGMEVVVTTLLESAVGCHAAAQVALAVDDARHPLAHGLDTGRWLQHDVAEPLTPSGGRIATPPGPGLGVALTEESAA